MNRLQNFSIPLILLLFASTDCQAQDQSIAAAKNNLGSNHAKIEDLAWIAGHWQGKAMGGEFEETWSKPFGGSMMGMFKFVKDGKVSFYEFLTIVEKEESLMLRLKHFSSDLKGWEEKNKSVDFPLISVSNTVARFDGMVFKKIDDETLHIEVNINREGKAQIVKFVCQRAK